VGERGLIPKNLIKHVTGDVVIEERQARVFPLTNLDFLDDSVVELSRSLINKHLQAFHSERILEQVKVICHVSH